MATHKSNLPNYIPDVSTVACPKNPGHSHRIERFSDSDIDYKCVTCNKSWVELDAEIRLLKKAKKL